MSNNVNTQCPYCHSDLNFDAGMVFEGVDHYEWQNIFLECENPKCLYHIWIVERVDKQVPSDYLETVLSNCNENFATLVNVENNKSDESL